MYCLELFYHHGSRVKLRHEDELKLEGYALEAIEQNLINMYRIVHIEAGKTITLWKENDEHGK